MRVIKPNYQFCPPLIVLWEHDERCEEHIVCVDSEGGLLQAAQYPYSISHVWIPVVRKQLGDPSAVENCQSKGICCEGWRSQRKQHALQIIELVIRSEWQLGN